MTSITWILSVWLELKNSCPTPPPLISGPEKWTEGGKSIPRDSSFVESTFITALSELEVMEDRGFDIIPCSLANPGLIMAAKAEFQVALQASKKESPELSCVVIKEFGPNCRELFSCGVELAMNEFITSRCGPYQDAVKDEAIMLTVTNNPQLPPYRAGPGKVLLFKPIDHGLSEEVGFLRYFEGSHKKSKSVGEMPERGICVELDQILAMDGDLVIRWPKTGGGIFMLQGIIKKSPK